MRRGRSLLLMLVAAASLAAPSMGSASQGAAGGECSGKVVEGGSASCSTTFEYSGSGFVSNVGSHGNVHTLLPSGTVTLEWIDPTGTTIFRAACTMLGASVSGSIGGGRGPFDLQNATCENDTVRPSYQPGIQTLRVEATEISCGFDLQRCGFHGRLDISAGDSLF